MPKAQEFPDLFLICNSAFGVRTISRDECLLNERQDQQMRRCIMSHANYEQFDDHPFFRDDE